MERIEPKENAKTVVKDKMSKEEAKKVLKKYDELAKAFSKLEEN